MPESQPSCALPLGSAEIPHRRKIDLWRNASLQEMEQCRDGGGRESQQRQRMNEAHINKRSARPNGMSVCT